MRLKLSAIFELLDRELTEAYGVPVQWQKILKPPGGAVERLREDLHRALEGDGPNGELTWQTILVEIFPVARDIYLNLADAERVHFDNCFNTIFFLHAATQPIINGEKVLALIEAGVVSIIKLGKDYGFRRDFTGRRFEFSYTDSKKKPVKDVYDFVVNACGQSRTLDSDESRLTRNLLRREIVQFGRKKLGDPGGTAEGSSGTMLIDPVPHRVVVPAINSRVFTDLPIYGVGAMTRGQIIDASMAYGIARSTSVVSQQVIEQLRHHVLGAK